MRDGDRVVSVGVCVSVFGGGKHRFFGELAVSEGVFAGLGLGWVPDEHFALRLEVLEGVQLEELLPREVGLERRVREVRRAFFRFVFARVSRGDAACGEGLARVVLPRRLLRYLPVGLFVEVFPRLDRHGPGLRVLDPLQLAFAGLGARLGFCARDPGFF